MKVPEGLIEKYKKKGIDLSWMLQSSPNIRDRYEEVGYDPDTRGVNIHGATFTSGEIPGTSLHGGRHHITNPMTLAEALEQQLGYDVPVRLTPEERKEAERQRVVDGSWMSEGAQRMYQGVKGAMSQPISFPYAPGSKVASPEPQEAEKKEEPEEKKEEETSADYSALEGVDIQGPENFIKHIAPVAQREARRVGLFPSVVIAQAALESGWGRSGLASGGNNIFGVKIGSWKGATRGRYRKYSNVGESLKDYIDSVMAQSRYDIVKNAKTPADATRALSRAGYAANPNYPSLLMSIIRQYNLTRFD